MLMVTVAPVYPRWGWQDRQGWDKDAAVMKTVVVTSDQCDLHDTGEHVESARRRPVVMTHLEAEGLLMERAVLDAPLATDDDLGLVHSRRYIDLIGRACREGGGWLDHDTFVSPGGDLAARAAAGAAMLAVDQALGEARRAFAIVRPPGHHALRERGMGFCIYNGVSVAAAHALTRHALDRVLLVDWDVHHGNGTQDVFLAEPRLCFFSVHQWPLYPGTGRVDEMGSGEAFGATVNVPVPPKTGDAGYGRVFREVLAPIARRYRPQLVIVSAGYDAHRDDPLGGVSLTTGGFAALAADVVAIAEEHCAGRIAFVLEGGYNLTALAQSVAVTLRVSDGQAPGPPAAASDLTQPDGSLDHSIAQARALHGLNATAPEAPAG